MPKQVDAKISKSVTVIVICVVLILLFVGWMLIGGKKTAPIAPTTEVLPKKIKRPVKQQPVIDANRLENDPALQSQMQARKDAYGVGSGLDFIVKPDESIKIGDRTVPMSEILEKIRLQKGDIIENDLKPPPDLEKILAQRKQRIEALIAIQQRYEQIEKRLQEPPESGQDKDRQALARELAELGETVALFKRYQSTLLDLEKARKNAQSDDADTRASARTTLRTLNREIEKIERDLRIPRIPDKQTEAYGIYIVRPGDNIWNIHFQFLKDYFSLRNIALAPMSDEPDARGFSSGVGKILKFSENMVYIYNLKEKRLDVDLNLLQPLSKIVIFNMGEVFALLDPIDYTRVNRIRFDGDTLWVPAEQ